MSKKFDREFKLEAIRLATDEGYQETEVDVGTERSPANPFASGHDLGHVPYI
jgi:hypothetical protein